MQSLVMSAPSRATPAASAAFRIPKRIPAAANRPSAAPSPAVPDNSTKRRKLENGSSYAVPRLTSVENQGLRGAPSISIPRKRTTDNVPPSRPVFRPSIPSAGRETRVPNAAVRAPSLRPTLPGQSRPPPGTRPKIAVPGAIRPPVRTAAAVPRPVVPKPMIVPGARMPTAQYKSNRPSVKFAPGTFNMRPVSNRPLVPSAKRPPIPGKATIVPGTAKHKAAPKAKEPPASSRGRAGGKGAAPRAAISLRAGVPQPVLRPRAFNFAGPGIPLRGGGGIPVRGMIPVPGRGVPPRRPGGYMIARRVPHNYDPYGVEEPTEDDLDFIDDTPDDDEEWRRELRSVTGYDPADYAEKDLDEAVETDVFKQSREELLSSMIAQKEDAEELKRIMADADEEEEEEDDDLEEEESESESGEKD
eukprot:Gregarina_sp_Poly_1__10744@NODE_819_length_6147_cov_44_607072_g593_i0_p1_GENE_NODE_819_length_6147_cov_44_607072_g593_i0NODE_819_length_6147_cov_44_607072_g593_i0_p1_ORF_typecomplete_len416_score66_18SPT2/PF08243_11/1_2e07Fes1/PF08609_10/0_096_NODE_819_length_6147_cov_44_607072_g593_i040705317